MFHGNVNHKHHGSYVLNILFGLLIGISFFSQLSFHFIFIRKGGYPTLIFLNLPID